MVLDTESDFAPLNPRVIQACEEKDDKCEGMTAPKKARARFTRWHGASECTLPCEGRSATVPPFMQ